MSAYILPGFLSADDCAAAQACFPHVKTAVVDRGSGVTRDDSLRRSRVSFLVDGQGQSLLARVRALLVSVNARHFHFDLNGAEPLQLAEYAAGDEYGWHLDIGPGEAQQRKLSASVQLSAPGDYDGGDLELWGTPAVERAQGAIIVFPSYLLHRVTPVTRGVRRSLVAWATGILPYR